MTGILAKYAMNSPKARYLRTKEIASAVGVHPNTVRLYEQWGLLPPIERSAAGYRLFTEDHLYQMRLARLALTWPYPGGKDPVDKLVRCAAHGDFEQALELARQYLANVHQEIKRAEAALNVLEQWADGKKLEEPARPLLIGEAAAFLDVNTDMLRNWDRNGLLDVPRCPERGYRLYGAEELGRARVIRLLRQAGYSLMAILRMLIEFDRGLVYDFREALDTPRPDEEVFNVADRWLTTLEGQEKRALDIIDLLQEMKSKRMQTLP